MKEIAPSDSSRKWFAHKEERREAFRQRYTEELKGKKDLLKQLVDLEKTKKLLCYVLPEKRRGITHN